VEPSPIVSFCCFFGHLTTGKKSSVNRTYKDFFEKKIVKSPDFQELFFFLKLQYLNNWFDVVTKINEPMGVALLIKAFQLYQESTPNFHNFKKSY
jgi:hypothetical protein